MNIYQKKLATITKLFKTGYKEMWNETLSYYWSRKQVKLLRKDDNTLNIDGLNNMIKIYKEEK
jgi:hypothetical protein